jgi:hypothetical protein
MLERFIQNAKSKNDEWLIEAHYHFCREFGYISVEEFAEIPIPTFYNLAELISKEHQERNKKNKGKK